MDKLSLLDDVQLDKKW